MRKAEVYMHNTLAGYLVEKDEGAGYSFTYEKDYAGEPVSLTMSLDEREFHFTEFPSFFDGLLPEGVQLDGLLRQRKLDKYDYFSQLMATGGDLVGAVTVKEIP